MDDLTERLAGIRQRSQEADRKSDRHSDIMALADSQSDVEALLNAVEAVLEWHQPRLGTRTALNPELLCTCDIEYPCEPVQAITEHLEPPRE